MNKSTHTPGPLHVGNVNGQAQREIADAYSAIVAKVEYVENAEKRDALAHLIAAAPELLALLEKAINEIEHGGMNWASIRCFVKDSRVVIARARGEN